MSRTMVCKFAVGVRVHIIRHDRYPDAVCRIGTVTAARPRVATDKCGYDVQLDEDEGVLWPNPLLDVPEEWLDSEKGFVQKS